MSSNFSDDKEVYIGYMEASFGLGLMLGPPLAGIIYGQIGFFWTFFSFSLLLLINFAIQFFLIPRQLNFSGKETER